MFEVTSIDIAQIVPDLIPKADLLWSIPTDEKFRVCSIGKGQPTKHKIIYRDHRRFSIHHATIAQMFLEIYCGKASNFSNRLIFELPELAAAFLHDWGHNNPLLPVAKLFSLDVLLSSVQSATLLGYAATCLNNYTAREFGVQAVYVTRKVNSWVLKQQSIRPHPALDSPGGPVQAINIKNLMYRMNSQFSEDLPFIDETKIKGEMMFSLPTEIKTIQEINTALQKHALEFVKELRMLQMVVFKNSPIHSLKLVSASLGQASARGLL